jgi:hypothetical protein
MTSQMLAIAPVHIFVIVKVPVPVHPPLRTHVPAMVLLVTVPVRVNALPAGVPDTIVNWKAPVTLPLRFPLSTNDPVCVPPEVKQPVVVVKLRFVPVTTVLFPCASDVVNMKAGVVSAFVNVAVQLPVTVPVLLELPLPPHAASTTPSARTIAIPNCFINHSLEF